MSLPSPAEQCAASRAPVYCDNRAFPSDRVTCCQSALACAQIVDALKGVGTVTCDGSVYCFSQWSVASGYCVQAKDGYVAATYPAATSSATLSTTAAAGNGNAVGPSSAKGNSAVKIAVPVAVVVVALLAAGAWLWWWRRRRPEKLPEEELEKAQEHYVPELHQNFTVELPTPTAELEASYPHKSSLEVVVAAAGARDSGEALRNELPGRRRSS